MIGKIIELTCDMAVVEINGVTCAANIEFLPQIAVGDWCLVEAGFLIKKLSQDETEEAEHLQPDNIEQIAETLDPNEASSLGGG